MNGDLNNHCNNHLDFHQIDIIMTLKFDLLLLQIVLSKVILFDMGSPN